MPFLEALAIWQCVELWGPDLTGKRIQLHSDCKGVVQAFNRGTATDPCLLEIIRRVMSRAVQHSFVLRFVHLSSHENLLADLLSRQDLDHHDVSSRCVVESQREPVPFQASVLWKGSSPSC